MNGEAKRIVGCMYGMAQATGTTSARTIDEILENYSDIVICQGMGRRMKFTKITENTYKWETEKL